MNLDASRDDLTFLRRVSEQGRYAPLLGGRYLVMWGSVIAAAYLGQYAILSGRFGLPGWSLLAMWAVAMTVAGIAMTQFRRTMEKKPGNQAIGNQVERWVWMSVGIGIFAYTMGVIAAVVFTGAPAILFDIIVALGFAGYGAAFLVVARIARVGWMHAAAIGAFAGCFMVPLLAGQAVLYLAAAVVVAAVAVVPGIILLRQEPPALTEEA